MLRIAAALTALLLLPGPVHAQLHDDGQIVHVAPPLLSTVSSAGTTSATPGAFTTALAATSSRKGAVIQNTSSGTLYVFLGAGTPTLASSFQVAPGQPFNLNIFGGGVLIDQVQVAGSLASQSYVVATQ